MILSKIREKIMASYGNSFPFHSEPISRRLIADVVVYARKDYVERKRLEAKVKDAQELRKKLKEVRKELRDKQQCLKLLRI